MQTDRIYCGDALTVLNTLPDNSVNCCVTSPPYYALRDYGVDGQIGREETPALYVERLTSIFREVRRVLTPDGTLWLNIADTYAGKGNQGEALDPKYPNGRTGQIVALNGKVEGCKAKDMIGIPWLLAFALRADGWYLRSDIIWQKANPMPESTKDRPSRCYEHIFLLSKSRRYYYDAAAIAEPVAETTVRRMKGARSTATKHGSGIPGQQNIQKINLPRAAGTYTDADIPQLRNKRDVWQINTVPYRGGHFAAFPPKLAETCLLAGCPPGGVVLDPFLGSGTTAAVAKQLGRHYICTVKLKNKDLSHLPVEVLTEEQLSAYSLYMRTLGNRPDLFGQAQYPNASTIKQPTYYDIPPEALKDDRFAAMMEEATKYIGYPYVWGGSSPSTSFDCSGYISWVLNHSGWNVGRQTAQGLYNLCTPVSTAQVKPGDLVFFKGTYDTPGVSHCGIYVGNSIMLHCGDPISYTNLNSKYWQEHFYSYGRLP